MKKNIMFLIGEMRSGGAERVVCNLCNSLRNSYNVTLVVGTINNADKFYIPNVEIIEIPRIKSSITFIRLYIMIINCLKLKKLKKNLKIDTTVSFISKYNILNYLSKYNDKVILSVRNFVSKQDSNPSKIKKILYKHALKKADLIVNVSQSVMDDTINYYNSPKDRNIVIPNFCDYENIRSLWLKKISPEHEIYFSGNIVISSGRYTFQKGQWHLIRAFQNVVKEIKNAKLILTGRGELKEYYQKLIKLLHLENNVFILDFIDNIYAYMKHADIFVLNSFYEGMPNILLEAMACDLPIIATDSPGGTKEILVKEYSNMKVKEITEADYGILIPMCDGIMYKDEALTKEEEMLSQSIIMLLKNKKLRENYIQKNSERLKDFSKDLILEKWKSVL